MPYLLSITQRALDDLALLPETMKSRAADQLESLANDPTKLARPSVSPPYPPNQMMYLQSYDYSETSIYVITIFFRYSQDETTLIVLGVGHGERLLPNSPWSPDDF